MGAGMCRRKRSGCTRVRTGRGNESDAVELSDHKQRGERAAMHSIFYIIGVIVVILAVLSLLGLA